MKPLRQGLKFGLLFAEFVAYDQRLEAYRIILRLPPLLAGFWNIPEYMFSQMAVNFYLIGIW